MGMVRGEMPRRPAPAAAAAAAAGVYGCWALTQPSQPAEAADALRRAGAAPALLKAYWAAVAIIQQGRPANALAQFIETEAPTVGVPAAR